MNNRFAYITDRSSYHSQLMLPIVTYIQTILNWQNQDLQQAEEPNKLQSEVNKIIATKAEQKVNIDLEIADEVRYWRELLDAQDRIKRRQPLAAIATQSLSFRQLFFGEQARLNAENQTKQLQIALNTFPWIFSNYINKVDQQFIDNLLTITEANETVITQSYLHYSQALEVNPDLTGANQANTVSVDGVTGEIDLDITSERETADTPELAIDTTNRVNLAQQPQKVDSESAARDFDPREVAEFGKLFVGKLPTKKEKIAKDESQSTTTEQTVYRQQANEQAIEQQRQQFYQSRQANQEAAVSPSGTVRTQRQRQGQKKTSMTQKAAKWAAYAALGTGGAAVGVSPFLTAIIS